MLDGNKIGALSGLLRIQNDCTEKLYFMNIIKLLETFLVAGHIKKLLRESDLQLQLGFVQTGTANANSTQYIKDELVHPLFRLINFLRSGIESYFLMKKIPVTFSLSGAKNMRLNAQEFDIGVYFDSSGHGSVVYSQKATDAIRFVRII